MPVSQGFVRRPTGGERGQCERQVRVRDLIMKVS
jgi:hypothetical protein